MKHLILLFCLVFAPLAKAADNAQLVQTNVNVQNKVESTNKVDQPSPADVDKDASVAIQQEVVAVQQKEEAPSQPSPQPQPNAPPAQQPAAGNAQNVQLLKEANSQYQYQINSRYEEKTRPVYGEPVAGQLYVGQQTYPHVALLGYPYRKENNHYQEEGNGQRRAESNVALDEGLRSQYENQDHSTYTRQRSQSYSEYGKGESSPEYNTYTYKRMYY